MIYYFLLSYLRREHYAAVGIEDENVYYLSDKDKLRIIENLNGKAKAVIRRDFLISEFQDAPPAMPQPPSCSDLRRSTCPKRLPKSERVMMKSMRNATSASRKRKQSSWCRTRPGRKRSSRKNRNPMKRHKPKM